MNNRQFIKSNIIKELTLQGATPYNAERSADYALGDFRRKSDLGKDPFGELLRIAAKQAMSFDPSFSFVMPKGR